MSEKILLVDDEKDMLYLLQRMINENTDHEVHTASDPVIALEMLARQSFSLLINDLKMPKMDGIQLLDEAKKIDPDIPIVILTAYATIETAVQAIHKGAFDYLTKPFSQDRLILTIEKVMTQQKLARENAILKQKLAEKESEPYPLGSTPVIKGIFSRIRQVAPTTATVLITGPSGTGKELAARSIHLYSQRNKQKFITINCTAIPENVLESELFGHVKGSFTGAWKDKKGLVEEAQGGTLFLDEIGDLGFSMQAKLLRLLQEGEYKPVGSISTQTADVRFVAATNHDLKQDIKEKKFREDLFYRLNVVHFELPPLNMRRQDIPLLAYNFLQKYNALNNKKVTGIAPDALQVLVGRNYPGNIRELENIIERGVIFCRGETLKLDELCLDQDESMFKDIDDDWTKLPFKEAKDKIIQEFHIRYFGPLLKECGGNISKAAEKAGIQRQYLHRLIKDSGMETGYYKEDHTPEEYD